MKNINTVLVLSLVTLFNAGCSGCVPEKKAETAAPVTVEEKKIQSAPTVSITIPERETVSTQESGEKESDVFKWANRKEK